MNVGELKVSLSADVSEFEKGLDLAGKALQSMETKGIVSADKMAGMITDAAEMIKGKRNLFSEAGSYIFGAIDENVPNITQEITASAGYMMESLQNVFLGYEGQMNAVGINLGRQIGEGLAAGIAQSMSAIDVSSGVYENYNQAPSIKNTYNNYKTTYNASGKVSAEVDMADFENRIRRAYA